MTQHIAKLTSSCFYQLRRLPDTSSGRTGTRRSAGVLVCSYGNSVLAGLPKSVIMPLQRVHNAAVRLILHLQMNEHVTPALRQLHWLPVDRRVDFKLCTMMHSIHTGRCPTFSSDMVRVIAVNQMRPGLRSANIAHCTLSRVVVLRLASVRSHTLVLSPGTISTITPLCH